MAENERLFQTAVSIIHERLPRNSAVQSNFDEKLQLYGYYKQATGAVIGERPGVFDQLGRAKWDSWAKKRHYTPDQAKRLYVETLVKVCLAFATLDKDAELD